MSISIRHARGGMPPARGFIGSAHEKKKSSSENMSHTLGGFSTHGLFGDGFLFLVKELGLLTNRVHWVRVLDVVGSYMYIVL
jgi:hypothetical protein